MSTLAVENNAFMNVKQVASYLHQNEKKPFDIKYVLKQGARAHCRE